MQWESKTLMAIVYLPEIYGLIRRMYYLDPEDEDFVRDVQFLMEEAGEILAKIDEGSHE